MNAELETEKKYFEAIKALRENNSMKIVMEQFKSDLIKMGMQMMIVDQKDFPQLQGRMIQMKKIIDAFTDVEDLQQELTPETTQKSPPGFF